uniref:Uncharacterized protein n=1 Tax=Schizaphis graminum TaxID=13262 RepID=A0A2S2P2Y6_SCHGA
MRAENIQKMNEIQQRFTQPRLRMIKSPWEAALETGSVESAFQEMSPNFPPRGYIVAPTSSALEALKDGGRTSRATVCSTPTRTATPKSYQDIYMPKIPRGWNTQCNRQQPPTYEPAYVAPSKNVQLPSYKDYLSLSNYNTAPRGWKQGDTIFYRPVTFNNQPNREDTRRKSFTDF